MLSKLSTERATSSSTFRSVKDVARVQAIRFQIKSYFHIHHFRYSLVFLLQLLWERLKTMEGNCLADWNKNSAVRTRIKTFDILVSIPNIKAKSWHAAFLSMLKYFITSSSKTPSLQMYFPAYNSVNTSLSCNSYEFRKLKFFWCCAALNT